MTQRFRLWPMAALLSVVASQSLALAPCNGADVRIISPHGTGISDLMARVVAEQLTARLGQTFYVEPVTGAGGAIGVRALAEAAPDGCTLGIVGLSTLVVAPLVDDSVGYDPLADFSNIAMIGGGPAVLAVNAGLGITTFDQLTAAMTSDGLVPTLATPGRTTITAILPTAIFGRLGAKAVIVPFKDTAEAVVAAADKNVDAVSLTYSTMREQIKAGALIPLYVSSPERLADLPDVPTLAELGQADLETLIWFGLSGPAGMDPAMVAELSAATTAILSDAKASEPLVKADATVLGLDSAGMTEMLARQTKAYSAAIAQMTFE